MGDRGIFSVASGPLCALRLVYTALVDRCWAIKDSNDRKHYRQALRKVLVRVATLYPLTNIGPANKLWFSNLPVGSQINETSSGINHTFWCFIKKIIFSTF